MLIVMDPTPSITRLFASALADALRAAPVESPARKWMNPKARPEPVDITSTLAWLGNAVPEPVEPGYHLCYATPNDEDVVMPIDFANTVEITHGILAGLERSLECARVPPSKHNDDDAHYAPLRPSDCPRAGISTSASSTTTTATATGAALANQ